MAQVQSTLERTPVAPRLTMGLHRNQTATARPAGLHREVESMLRDLAFVYRATRAVRAAMTTGAAVC